MTKDPTTNCLEVGLHMKVQEILNLKFLYIYIEREWSVGLIKGKKRENVKKYKIIDKQ